MNGLVPDPMVDPLAERLGRLSPDRLAELVCGLQERIDGLRARVAGPIAVVGMALRLPGAASPDALWDLLCRGEIAIGPVPVDRWSAAALSPHGVPPFGGFIDGVDRFDATFFRIPPAEAAAIDPQQRLAAEVAWEALESAGYALAERRPPATGVFLGMSTDDYKARFLAGEPAAIDPRMATGTANSVAAGRLSYLFDLSGPAMVVDTACSSSLVAAHLACRSLRAGECDMALAGGVGLLIEPELTVAFSKLGMLSALGRCATFMEAADGYVRGEGAAMLVLKRWEDAQRDGDAVLAVIRGSAVNQDGRSNGLTAPSGTAQRAVIAAALADAGLTAAEVDGVECHGTATPLGDPIEAAALAAVYGAGRAAGSPLLLGSVKANIGHLEAAAGAAGVAKAILCLMHNTMPAQPSLGTLNPRVDWAAVPLRVADTTLPLGTPGARLARLGVSSFGFSGTNAHLILEAPPLAPERPAIMGAGEQLIVFSAPTPETLVTLADRVAATLRRQPAGEVGDLAATLILDRRLYAARCAAVGADAAQLAEAVVVAAAAAVPAARPDAPRIAFLFTGQGSQWPGMGRALAEQEPVFKRALQDCADILRGSDLDLPGLLDAEDGRLDQTGNAQPALFAVEYALGCLWRHWGVQPDIMIGHSIGEYAAACLAGVMDLADALTLVATRGRLMQSLPAGGGMLAIAASEAQARDWLVPHPDLDLAVVNAVQSVVVAGPLAALDHFAATLPECGLRRLSVSHAFHSRAMDPILEEFARAVGRVRLRLSPRPVISALTGKRAEADMADPAYWVRQLRAPVRFADAATILDADVAIELGPRAMLLGQLDHPGLLRLPSMRAGEATNGTILRSLGALFSAGGDVDWRAFHGDRNRRPGLAPTTPFRRERHWTERSSGLRPGAPPTEVPAQPVAMTVVATAIAATAVAATEDQIRAILAEAMQLPPAAIQPATPFVELGADSLILTQVAARIERRFGIKIPRRDLFTSLNTVVALHRHVTVAMPAVLPEAAIPALPLLEPGAARHIDCLARRLRDRLPGSWRSRDDATANLADSRGSAGYRAAVQPLLFPLVGDRAEGARIWDVDGNEFLDITMGFGVQLFGHAAPFITEALGAQLGRGLQLGPQARLAGEAARRIHRLTGVDRVAFCNTGTEAVMTALRLARLATGRSKIALFEGSYHGHFDGVLANAGAEDGDPQPLSPGTPTGFVRDLLVLDYADPEGSMALLERHRHDLAAVLVEPVQSRRPGLQPRDFLKQLRAWTERASIALIFDEVLLGFRIALGGAQAWAGVTADLVTYGKIIGGGLPIGVVAGRRSFMDRLDGGAWALGNTGPSAPTIFFAGTFNKNPLTMAAAVAVLEQLEREGPGLQDGLNRRTAALAQRLNAALAARTGAMRVDSASSLFRFVGAPDVFYYNLLDQGLYVWEGRTCFLSTRHTDADLDRIVGAVTASADALVADGLLPGLVLPPVATAAIEDSIPLTAGQHGLWLTCQMSDAVSAAYNQSLRLSFDAPLDNAALGRALAALVRRHPNLRARFEPDGHLRILPHATIPLEDLAGDPDTAETTFCWQPFELESGPPLRAGLSWAHARFRLTLVLPHLVTDGWSLSVMVAELAALYRAERSRVPAALPEAGSPRAYVETVDARAADPALAAAWLARFTPPPAPLRLPMARPRPALQSFAGGRVTRPLGAERLQRLRALCGAERVGLFAAGLAAFAMLLGRLGRTDDLAIGVLSAGQSAHAMPDLVGYYANLLPIRVRLDAAASVSALLAQCQQALDVAMDGRDYPFAALVRALGLPRDPSRPPLVSVGFNLDRLDAPPDFGVPLQLEANAHGAVRWDLFFNLVAAPEGITLQADYATAIFDARQIEAWADDYVALLDRFVQAPQARQSSPLLIDRILDHAAAHPRHAAVEDGAVTLTYGELVAEADRLAARLQVEGVQPGEVVAADLGRSVTMIVAMLAVWRIGATFMPLEPTHPPEYRRMLMADADAACCLCDPAAPAEHADAPLRLALRLGGPAEGPAFTPAPPSPDVTAYLLYTSGSTGRPKGVLVSHGALSAYTVAVLERIAIPSDMPLRFAVVSSLAADLGYTCVFGSLWTGGTLRIFQQTEMRDPAAFAAAMTAPPIDVLKIVPTHLAALLDWPEPAMMLPRARLVLGGEASHWPLIARLWGLAPACRVFNHYGPSETTVGAAAVELTPGLQARLPETVPLGVPLRHARIAVDRVDDEDGGEILIAGDGVATGYLNRPEQEAARFAPDPQGPPGARLYRTGDRGRQLPDGLLLFLGRLDDEVKIRGHRVAPGAVAARLRDCPGVRDSAVLTEENARGAPRLLAYVVTDGLNEAALRRWAAAHLPPAMVPDTLRCLAVLPRTANGKVDRDRLRAPEAAAPAAAAPAAASDTLLGLWREILAAPEAGAEDDFFSLGGDSIMAIRIAGRARAAGLRFNAQLLFEHPTVTGLLAAIAGTTPVIAPAPPAAAATGPIPLSPVQRAFFALGMPQPSHWCMTAVLRLSGRPDAATIGRALSVVEGRHAALRLRFGTDGAVRLAEAGAVAAPILVDQTGLDAAARRAQEDAVAAERIRRVDIASGPLLAAALLDRGADEPAALLVAVHHLVFDAISWGILALDLAALLDGAVLPAPGPGFDRWCQALSRHARTIDAERPVWQGIEARIAPILPRVVCEGAANREGRVARDIIRLPAAETAACKAAASAMGRAGLHDAVLAALVVALRPLSRGPVVIDVEGHGREAIDPALEPERMIGWFTTHYPLALDLAAADTPRAQIGAVRSAWRALPGNGLGYGVLRYLTAAEGLDRDPDVSFNFLGDLDTGTASPFERFGSPQERDPAAPRRHLLVVEAYISAGALTIELLYPQDLVSDAVISEIADGMEAWFDRFTQAATWQSLPAELALDADDLQALTERLGL
jgi:amino acid adenylation domain-containing protein/non-ribosomal peptide synthase protein (TIGR01720 family)